MRALLSTEWAVEGGGGDEWHWKVQAAEESANILPHAHTHLARDLATCTHLIGPNSVAINVIYSTSW